MTRSSESVSALILAGGRGQRMGGVDKGLQTFRGRPLVEHVMDRLAPLPIRINANRNLDTYRRYGVPVIGDEMADYQGPLAGVAAGLASCTTDWMLIVPCDSPLLPRDLAPRLMAAAREGDARIAAAHDGIRLQPVVALIHRDLHPSLQDYLAGGDRKIDLWYRRVGMVSADFSDQPDAFVNLNTTEEKKLLESSAP